MSSDRLNYQFGSMLATNERVEQKLRDFRATLDAFAETYKRLSTQWGGDAARNADQVSRQIGRFGLDTAAIVQRFLAELNRHLDESRRTEANNANLFG